KQKITTLQKDVAKVGFKFYDKTTTDYGAETEKQVKKYQKANGLTADGNAGKATLDSLKKAASNQATSNSKKASSTNSSNYYKKGMTNKGVKTLQKNLAQAGFIVVDKPTTYFGTQTEKQVKAFQRKHGLTVDGIAGQATLKKLKSDSTSKKSTSQLKSKYYLKGMTNTNIKTLQKDLAKAGFKVVDKPTTYYGVETEKQVKAFQKKYKLLPDGI